MSDSIAITSGKGGVGKTTFAVNLSIAFKKISKEVFLLDTDLGMANSHVLLGDNPTHTLADVLSGSKSVSEVIYKNKYGVNLISGGTASNNVLNIENKSRYSILNGIENHLLNFNSLKLIVDIAAGADDSALIFSMACDRVVVVIVGEPTSFIDAYSLIKAAFLDYKINNFGIVLNMTVSEMQAKLNFNKFQSITQKFLDVNLKYLGHVNSSQRIRNSIISRTPLMSKSNKNSDTKYFENISQALSSLDSNNTGSIKFFD